jgi:hypothetical protein
MISDSSHVTMLRRVNEDDNYMRSDLEEQSEQENKKQKKERKQWAKVLKSFLDFILSNGCFINAQLFTVCLGLANVMAEYLSFNLKTISAVKEGEFNFLNMKDYVSFLLFLGLSIGILLVYLIKNFVFLIQKKQQQLNLKFCTIFLLVFYPVFIWQSNMMHE